MKLIDRWKAPTPIFWKTLMKICLTLSAGAVAMLTADAASSYIPGFSFKLYPMAAYVCKNVVVVGGAIAAMCKFAVKKDPEEKAN